MSSASCVNYRKKLRHCFTIHFLPYNLLLAIVYLYMIRALQSVPLKTSAGISRVKGSEFMSSATAMPSVTTPIRRRTCLCLNILTTRAHQGFRRFLNPVPPQDQMTCQRLILISRSPMMHFCLPITKHFLILLQLIHGMYKSILTIVELVLNLCFMVTFSSMSAWNNGKALYSESVKPGSILMIGEIFYFYLFSFFSFFWICTFHRPPRAKSKLYL